MSEALVAIAAKAPAISYIGKVEGVQNWGDAFVMSEVAWRNVVEAFAYRPLNARDLAAWRAMTFVGEVEYGVWLRDVNRAEVARHTRAAKWKGDAVHISHTAYESLRNSYYPWWQKTYEQEGFDLIKPRQLFWKKSGEPRPAEMTAYRQALAAHDFSDGMPEAGGVVMKLSVRCDPGLKLLKLAQAKQKK